MRKISAAVPTVFASAALLLLSGCAGTVPMHAAPDANNPACADVTVRLPQKVANLDKQQTNAQATGAWGEDGGVQLVCGEKPQGPTTKTCVNVDGVDWVIDDTKKPIYRFIAYGRTPGLSVYVNSEKASGTEAVVDLGPAVSQLPQKRKCLDVQDTLNSKTGAAG